MSFLLGDGTLPLLPSVYEMRGYIATTWNIHPAQASVSHLPDAVADPDGLSPVKWLH
jgi:hypothetical protein